MVHNTGHDRIPNRMVLPDSACSFVPTEPVGDTDRGLDAAPRPQSAKIVGKNIRTRRNANAKNYMPSHFRGNVVHHMCCIFNPAIRVELWLPVMVASSPPSAHRNHNMPTGAMDGLCEVVHVAVV